MPQQTFDPFFVTRQSAIILQDLARRCGQASAISVLHGRAGVGKSRLLERFASLYADDFFCLYLRCNEEGSLYNADQPQKLLPQQQLVTFLARHLPAKSVLLIDQFERLNAQTRSSIFEFWLTQALASQFKLILVISSASLASLKQQAEALALDIASVEVLPLSLAEQKEFIRLHCCPQIDQSPNLSRRQAADLRGTEGVFSALVLFLRQQGNDIVCKAQSLPVAKSVPGRMLPALFLVVLAVLVFGIFEWRQQAAIAPPDSPLQKKAKSDKTIQQTVVPIAQKDQQVQPVQKVQQVQQVQQVQKLSSKAPSQTPPDPHSALPAPAKPLENPQVLPKNPLQADSSSGIEHREKTPATSAPTMNSKNPLVQHAFQTAERWLAKTPAKGASIQIMTLRENDRAYLALEDYLQQMKHRGVDVEQIMVFRFWRAKQGMLGVLYGRYADPDTAETVLSQLPSALKTNHPMLRTIEGIKEDRRVNEN